MRKHLTTLRWYEDRLCSLSSSWLLLISFGCVAGLAVLLTASATFLDDVPFLFWENDIKSLLIPFDFLLLTSGALWVLSCTAGALWRRALLRFKGL